MEYPSSWRKATLIDLATLQRGFDLPVIKRESGSVPIFAANGTVGFHNVAKVSGPGVVTGRSGTIGKVHYVGSDYWPLNTSLFVKDFHGNHPKYVSWFLMWLRLERFHEGTGVPTLNRNNIHGLEVYIPPLPEQKRIAAILDKADAIRRKRQEALELAGTFLRSVFLKMFGDPVTNPMGWDEAIVGDYLDFLTSGSRGWAKYYSDSGTKFIRIQNVRDGFLSFHDCQYVDPPDTKEAERTRVQENDLLLSITADLGRTAVVDLETAQHGAHINQHLALMRLIKKVEPDFLSAYLESSGGRLQFKKLDQVGVKSGLNFNAIRSLKFYGPPKSLQKKYADIKLKFKTKLTSKLNGSIAEADVLFSSLQQRAFRGDL